MLEHCSPKALVFRRLAVMLAAALSSSFWLLGWPETLYRTWPSAPFPHVTYIRGPFWEFLRRSDVLLGKVKSVDDAGRGESSSSCWLRCCTLFSCFCVFPDVQWPLEFRQESYDSIRDSSSDLRLLTPGKKKHAQNATGEGFREQS